jgi:DNA-binding HxlR family transcriptional regulator
MKHRKANQTSCHSEAKGRRISKKPLSAILRFTQDNTPKGFLLLMRKIGQIGQEKQQKSARSLEQTLQNLRI